MINPTETQPIPSQESEPESSSEVTEEEIHAGIQDESGVIYSKDGKRLLACHDIEGEIDYKVRDGVKIICDGAFRGSSLKSVTIPESVTEIGAVAFGDCYSLLTIEVSDKNRFYVTDNDALFSVFCISDSMIWKQTAE